MALHKKIDKIITIKEREKDEAVVKYNESIEEFEKVATKLYDLLKEKEELEATARAKLQNGLSIIQIKQQTQYILQLEQHIQQLQTKVMNARNKMNKVENLVMEKNIEVKKFNKVKENHATLYNKLMDQEENKQMDEISIQQYMNRGN